MVIATGNHPKALWPGIHAWFGAEYSKHPLECAMIFDVRSSEKAYEEVVRMTGFGLAPVKAEGASTSYATHSQKDTTRFTHTAYSLGYIVTKEELDDNLYREVSQTRARALAHSMKTTKEIVGANVLNRAFNASYTGGDGKEMIATDHPSNAGTYSNELNPAADLSEAALEDLTIQISQAVDYNGLQIALRPVKLVIAPDNIYEAQRILKSELQSGTETNDINAMRTLSVLPGGFMVNHYLTDADAWFVKTDVTEGMIMFQRTEYAFTRDSDFDTENAKAKAYERYSFGWADPLGVYGSPGA